MNESGTAPLPSPLVPAVPKRNRRTPVGLFGLVWLPCCLPSFLMPHERKRKRNGNGRPTAGRTGTETETKTETTPAISSTETETKQATPRRNRNETRNPFGERKPEKEGDGTPPPPSFLPSDIPVFLSFPVPVRATIKTIFPPLRYVSPTFNEIRKN